MPSFSFNCSNLVLLYTSKWFMAIKAASKSRALSLPSQQFDCIPSHTYASRWLLLWRSKLPIKLLSHTRVSQWPSVGFQKFRCSLHIYHYELGWLREAAVDRVVSSLIRSSTQEFIPPSHIGVFWYALTLVDWSILLVLKDIQGWSHFHRMSIQLMCRVSGASHNTYSTAVIGFNCPPRSKVHLQSKYSYGLMQIF